ncbi:MAG: hypothetical protein ACYC6B_01040 [Thermoleophilia bacterium]
MIIQAGGFMTSIYRSKKLKNSTHLIYWGLAILLIALPASGCGQSRVTTKSGLASGADLKPALLTNSSLQRIVVSGIGDASLLRAATLEGEGMEKVINIGIDRPTTCGDGSVEAIMATQTGKIMSELFKYPEVSSVTIIMFGVTRGVKSDDVAVKVTVDQAAALENDWAMFGPWSMSSMVTEYYIHPEILKNASAGSGGSTSLYH